MGISSFSSSLLCLNGRTCQSWQMQEDSCCGRETLTKKIYYLVSQIFLEIHKFVMS